jgi:hypothetical protein
MVSFIVPVGGGAPEFRFSVQELGVLFAGSRHGEVPQRVCGALIGGLARDGFSFWVGCASGVDRSFRKALSASEYVDRTFVGCAFSRRIRSLSNYGLFASVVVPKGLSPKAALRRRTLWLVKRCCLVVLFPTDPITGQWGKGSKLVYRVALDQLKPVFVICSSPPKGSDHYRVIGSCLYGAQGFWVVPHPATQGGPCDEE